MSVCMSDSGGGRIQVRLSPNAHRVFASLACFKELSQDTLLWQYVHRGLLAHGDERMSLEASLIDVPEHARSQLIGFVIEVARSQEPEGDLGQIVKEYVLVGMKEDLASPTALAFCRWREKERTLAAAKEMCKSLLGGE